MTPEIFNSAAHPRSLCYFLPVADLAVPRPRIRIFYPPEEKTDIVQDITAIIN